MAPMRTVLFIWLLWTPAAAVADIFDAYLKTEVPPADGFDFPVGNSDGQGSYKNEKTGKTHHGWYVATDFGEKFYLGIHPGEDWNGKGGGNTDAGQPVHAVAAGKVIYADLAGNLWGRVVMIQHVFYENHRKKRIRSLYAHLGEVKVKKGDTIKRRQVIGTIGRDPQKLYYAHLHLELRFNEEIPAIYWPTAQKKSKAWIYSNYASPTLFIKSHRNLFVPLKEKVLVLVDLETYKMCLYQQGRLKAGYDVSFGQGQGRKRRRGDLKTPKGMYFITGRKKGKFGGEYGAFYGGHWIKLNYPNRYDAAWGRRNKLINKPTEAGIKKDWTRRKLTNAKTRLGSGIGFHGWIEEWDNQDPRHLSWGCIVLHNRDIAGFYKLVSTGSMVVIF
jgi:hypothetical protein